MNTSEIESLLSKYYEGNTTLQEEQALRNFFQGNDVPAQLKSHQQIFSYYRNEQRQTLRDENFEQKLTSYFTEVPAEKTLVVIHAKRNRMLFVTGIAASFLLLVGLFFTFQYEVFKNSLTQSEKINPEVVYADASQALLLVSGNFNNGLKQIERLEMVDKAMQNMQLFNKFYQYQTLIINPDEMLNQSINSK